MRTLKDRQEIAWMLRGLGILGTGGGGDPYTWGTSIVNADLARGRVYQLVSPEEVEDDATVVSGGYLGSVAEDKSLDRIVDEWERCFELESAIREMESLLGRRINYLVPFEMGGGNTPVILSAGARLGIPVVDGDALGRAAPETQMTSFIGYGIKLTPMPIVDSKGTVIIVKESDDIFFPDEVGRFIVSTRQGLVANAHYPMSGADLKRAVIPNTITKAIELGKFASTLSGSPEEKLLKLSDYLRGFPLLWGRVINTEGENKGGFYYARVRIEGLGRFKGHVGDLTIKNEVMCARLDGRPVVIFPDLVLILDPNVNEGVMTPKIEEGQELLLVAVPCHPRLREVLHTKIGARAFAPERYGEDISFRPVEELLKEGL